MIQLNYSVKIVTQVDSMFHKARRAFYFLVPRPSPFPYTKEMPYTSNMLREQLILS